jgi:hypothetical protein
MRAARQLAICVRPRREVPGQDPFLGRVALQGFAGGSLLGPLRLLADRCWTVA